MIDYGMYEEAIAVQEWWEPGVLKPPMAMEYPEVTAWRKDQIAKGARVLTDAEWAEIHKDPR